MKKNNEFWEMVVIVVVLFVFVIYGLLFELMTFWRRFFPENHWIRVKLEGKWDL